MGNVIAVCISEKKGTQKKNVGSARFVEDWGIEGDAHAGNGTARSPCSPMTRSRHSALAGLRWMTVPSAKI